MQKRMLGHRGTNPRAPNSRRQPSLYTSSSRQSLAGSLVSLSSTSHDNPDARGPLRGGARKDETLPQGMMSQEELEWLHVYNSKTVALGNTALAETLQQQHQVRLSPIAMCWSVRRLASPWLRAQACDGRISERELRL